MKAFTKLSTRSKICLVKGLCLIVFLFVRFDDFLELFFDEVPYIIGVWSFGIASCFRFVIGARQVAFIKTVVMLA